MGLVPTQTIFLTFSGNLAQGTGLQGKFIHEIQVSWNGLEELKHANYILRSLPKGLKFLRAVSTKKSPKIMGLKGIHDSDALQHFAGYTYCPWCSKDGQNEGTIINHLRTVQYKLGLICDQCFSCPMVISDTLHQHGCQHLHTLRHCPMGGPTQLACCRVHPKSKGNVIY